MNNVIKMTIGFNFTERDILLYNHYMKKLNELKNKIGSNIDICHGKMHRGFRRNSKHKWVEVIIYDIVIYYSKDYEKPIMKVVA